MGDGRRMEAKKKGREMAQGFAGCERGRLMDGRIGRPLMEAGLGFGEDGWARIQIRILFSVG